MYGKDKAKEIRKLISRKTKGKTFKERYGNKKAKEIQSKISITKKSKGKTFKEIYGKEKAKEMQLKQSKFRKGRTYEDMYGKEKAIETKIKQSKKTRVWKKKIIINNLRNIIKEIGPITRSELPNLYHYHNICNAETIRQRFGSLDKLAIEGNIEFKLPLNKGRAGSTEKQILDNIEQEKEIILLRQYSIAGCFIDGYDKKNNIAYEIDEWHHKYKKTEDIIREDKIKKVLGCEFIRIKG